MVYQRDEEAVRNAREEKKQAEDELAIAALEKEIKLIDEAIEKINEQKEALEKQQKALEKEQKALQKQLDEITKYYDKLIKQQEKLFDAQIKALEKLKEPWEELAEVEEVAKAWGLVSDEMESLGFTVEDVLSGNEAAFNAFKDRYIEVLSQMHSEDKGFLSGLKEEVGDIPEDFERLYDAAGKADEAVDKIGTTASGSASGVKSLGDSASTAATEVDKLKTASEGVGDNLEKLQTVDLTEFTGKLSGVSEDIQGIIDKIGTSGAAGTLVGAFESLNNLKFEAFTTALTGLKSTISAVVGLLDGSGGTTGEDLTETSGMQGGAGAGGGNLVSALDAVKAKAEETIGLGGGDEEGGGGEESLESDGTVVGDFNALKGAISQATTAIGNGESDAAAEDLIGSITALGEKNTEILGTEESGVIGDWNKFNLELTEAKESITGMVEGLNNLADSYETELTVHLTIEGEGEYTGTATRNGKKGHWSFNVLNAIGLPGIGGEGISKLKHNALGTAKLPANFAGNWGYEGGKTLIAELGPELVVFPDGHAQTFDRPQIVDLPKNSVIFNHLQTDEILDEKNQIKAHAGGTTLPSGYSSISMSGSYNDLLNKVKAIDMPTMSGIKSTLDNLTKTVQSEIRNVATTKTNVTQNNTFNISGVTGEEVAQKINSTLTKTFQGMALNAYQRSMA